jgi:hypothetical protein
MLRAVFFLLILKLLRRRLMSVVSLLAAPRRLQTFDRQIICQLKTATTIFMSVCSSASFSKSFGSDIMVKAVSFCLKSHDSHNMSAISPTTFSNTSKSHFTTYHVWISGSLLWTLKSFKIYDCRPMSVCSLGSLFTGRLKRSLKRRMSGLLCLKVSKCSKSGMYWNISVCSLGFLFTGRLKIQQSPRHVWLPLLKSQNVQNLERTGGCLSVPSDLSSHVCLKCDELQFMFGRLCSKSQNAQIYLPKLAFRYVSLALRSKSS